LVMLVALLLVQAVWSLAPFYTQQETIDRFVGGALERSYFVIFNAKAPKFGLEKEKLQSWLPSAMPELSPENVQWIYEINGDDFRGFAVWTSPAAIDAVRAHDFIKYVEEDQVMRTTAPFTARADYGQVRCAQKGARNLATSPANLYANGYPAAGNATESWDWTQAVYNGYRLINSGSNTRIWIVDTGILANHQEFGSRVRVWQDFVSPAQPNGTDCNGHGTHCAGSAAGSFRGLAVGAELGNIRVLNCQGSGTNTGVVQGFNYVCNNRAANMANILSASLGGGGSQPTDDAINACNNVGVICVVAAGNNGQPACNYSPARATGAITVGATTKDDTLASFSNHGTCVNVLAPGVSIHSGWYTSNNAYNTISGTSMATPLTAGAIALYCGSVGATQCTPTNVRAAINRTATSGVVPGLPSGTPNYLVNANWN